MVIHTSAIIASQARIAHGKGTGHRARLNFGDICT